MTRLPSCRKRKKVQTQLNGQVGTAWNQTLVRNWCIASLVECSSKPQRSRQARSCSGGADTQPEFLAISSWSCDQSDPKLWQILFASAVAWIGAEVFNSSSQLLQFEFPWHVYAHPTDKKLALDVRAVQCQHVQSHWPRVWGIASCSLW